MNDLFASSPEHAIALLMEAFHRRDLETILTLYDDQACCVPAPDIEAHGTENIRALYNNMLQLDVTAQVSVSRVLQADNIALYLAHWMLTPPDEATQHLTSTVVLRHHPETGWKILIDNSRGPSILHHPPDLRQTGHEFTP